MEYTDSSEVILGLPDEITFDSETWIFSVADINKRVNITINF